MTIYTRTCMPYTPIFKNVCTYTCANILYIHINFAYYILNFLSHIIYNITKDKKYIYIRI